MSRFDLQELHRAIDAERERCGLSWSGLGRLVGVSASTIRRFHTADDAEADGVLALVRWLNVAPECFVDGAVADGTLLAPTEQGYVRVDMNLVAAASGNRRAATTTRTTIQRLVAVAQDSGQTVASLTRLSDI